MKKHKKYEEWIEINRTLNYLFLFGLLYILYIIRIWIYWKLRDIQNKLSIFYSKYLLKIFYSRLGT